MDDLIGRDVELARLQQRLHDAVGGRGRLVLLGGDPGVGKSRLAEELARRAAEIGMAVAWGRGVETEGAPAFWPWRQVLRDLAARRDPEELRAAAGGGMAMLSDISPDLGRLLGGTPEPLPDAVQARFQLFDAVSTFLCRCAAAAGLLVVLDDVHWADRSSLLLLRHLAGELPRARAVVLATHRDAAGDAGVAAMIDIIGAPGAESVRLRGLDRAGCALQLRAITGGRVGDAVAARVHAITEGNPFFTAEMARLLLDPATAASAVIDVPHTVREVLRRRVARLDESCRDLLDAAAVLGRVFSGELLAVTADRSVVTVLDALDAARAARVIEPGSSAGELRFAHALIRETLYADLSASRRHELHGRAAAALEWLHAQRLEPHLAAIAAHRLAAATSAEEAVEAAHWLMRAGAEAMRRLAWEEAVRLHGLALGSAGDRLDDDRRADALLAVATGLAHSGELEDALRTCVDASAAARSAGCPESMAAAALVLEGVSEPRWNATLVSLCDDALAALPADARALRARLLAQRTAWRVLSAEDDGAEEASASAVALAEESGDEAAVASALRVRQVVMSGPEGLDERRRIAARMLDIGARTGDPGTLAWGRLWQIDVDIETGDLQAARREVDLLATQLAGGRSSSVARWHLSRVRALLAQARGDFDGAAALADEAHDLMVRAGNQQAAGMRDAFFNGSWSHHRGVDPSQSATVRSYVERSGPFSPLVRTSLISVLVWSGRIEEARSEYRLLSPVQERVALPGMARLAFESQRAVAAAELGECADATMLYGRLLPFRDRHIGGGAPEYRGCLELPLGIVSLRCGGRSAAVDHLRRAVDAHRRAEAIPFVVESQCELATALLGLDEAEAKREAGSLARAALETAQGLGMVPFVARAQQLLGAQGAAEGEGSPLSRREEEVAQLVARGLTSREIAASLHLSERTAQNHVQHILDKLGFATRSQIAAWATARAARRAP